jgi:hypothetical protein
MESIIRAEFCFIFTITNRNYLVFLKIETNMMLFVETRATGTNVESLKIKLPSAHFFADTIEPNFDFCKIFLQDAVISGIFVTFSRQNLNFL